MKAFKLLPIFLSIACATVLACHGTDTCDFGGTTYTTTSRPEPAMGWTSWSFLRGDPTEASIQAQAQALHDSHLSDHGYAYVNVDDYYYEDPSKTVDSYGRWVIDPTRFPSGMAATAAFVHHLGLSFGMYVTPGIPVAAVDQNTPIEGTSYHAADIAVPGSYEIIYSFHNSMVYIDYTKPGAQSFIDSWAKLLASYGVDYLKLDGVGTFDIPDVQAWSQALENSGRAIHFEISKKLPRSSGCIWSTLANGWRIDDDIECNCSSTSYPLTSWPQVADRFNDVLGWQSFSHPGRHNNLDSIELGNGDNDGITPDERKTQMTLWALSASPLIIGSDLTNLDPGDLVLLTNDEVIAIDQAGVAAQQVEGGDAQVWVIAQSNGSYAVGLFNLGADAAPITATWKDVGIRGSADVRDVWANTDLGSFTDSFGATVASHGAALLRITPNLN